MFFLRLPTYALSLVVHVREKENKFLLERKKKKKSKRGFMMNSSLSNCGPTSKHVPKTEKRRCVFKDKQQSEIKSVKNDVINSSVFL